MAKFAILDINNIVQNIIVADSLEEASVLGTAVEITPSTNGGYMYIYEPKTKTFSRPVVEEDNA